MCHFTKRVRLDEAIAASDEMVRTRSSSKPTRPGPSKRARRRDVVASTIVASCSADAPCKPDPNAGPMVVDLGRDLEEAIFVRRPSRRNRSPYVCDVKLVHGGNECIAHVPNLDSGGKMREGVRVLCSRQKGVTADSLGPHGTPKCELIARLLRCEDLENASEPDGGVWISAHPALAEQIALGLLESGALDDRLHPSPIVKGEGIKTQKMLRRQSTESISNHYRPDFAVDHEDGTTTILEVKQVVDTDYCREYVMEQARAQKPHPAYSPKSEPYRRAGIFPWGRRGQQGPSGEKVVSARAIEHLRELAELASQEKNKGLHPCVLFICSRADAQGFRPNAAACPSFGKHLMEARRKGVRVLVQGVRWGTGNDVGKAFDGGPLELWSDLEEGDEFVVK